MNKAGILLRVSTEDQTEESQLQPCIQFANSRGWEIEEIYREQVSAYKKDVEREAKDHMMEDARKGNINHIVVWSLDRWTRQGADQLIKELNQLNQWNVELHSVQEDFLDSFNMSGELGDIIREFIQKIIAWQAQLESKRKSERVKAKHKEMKKNGDDKDWGRPSKDFDVDRAVKLCREGKGYRRIAKMLDADVSHMTVKRAIDKRQKEFIENKKD